MPNAQEVFLDTPGIHAPDTLLNRRMMDSIRAALDERDLLLFLADASRPFNEADEAAVRLIANTRAPVLLLLNKVDRVKSKSQLLPMIERYQAAYAFADYFPISALKGAGMDELRAAILARLPEGPQYFPPDYLTDQPERFLAAELVREKILSQTREEVPHSVAVLVDAWEESPRLTRISATIYVERAGQKGILIGAKGSMLKLIGTMAREEMEVMFSRKVFLELFVKVQPRWREDPAFLEQLDWHSMVGKTD
jgi:GTP-binding protein Era